MKVVIIEDEARAARELERLLAEACPQATVMTTLESVEHALEWFSTHDQPDLLLSDIQLADGLCFDLFRQASISSPVIFCTAFDEYLMHAFETHAISYLLKPVTLDKLEAALYKFRNMQAVFQTETQLPQLLQQLHQGYKRTLLVHQQEKIIPVPVQEIAFLYLDRPGIRVVTQSSQHFYISGTMEELEQTLDPALFFRANRQFLINRHAVRNAERYFARKLMVRTMVESPEPVIVSKARSTEFLQWLENA